MLVLVEELGGRLRQDLFDGHGREEVAWQHVDGECGRQAMVLSRREECCVEGRLGGGGREECGQWHRYSERGRAATRTWAWA